MEKNCDCQHQIECLTTDEEIIITSDSSENEFQISSIEEDDLQILEEEYKVAIRKGYSPYVNLETMTWWEYDDLKKDFIDTHIKAGSELDFIDNETIKKLWFKEDED